MNFWIVLASVLGTILALFLTVVVIVIINSIRDWRKEKREEKAMQKEEFRDRARIAYFGGLSENYNTLATEADDEGLEAVFRAGFEAGKNTKLEVENKEEGENN